MRMGLQCLLLTYVVTLHVNDCTYIRTYVGVVETGVSVRKCSLVMAMLCPERHWEG